MYVKIKIFLVKKDFYVIRLCPKMAECFQNEKNKDRKPKNKDKKPKHVVKGPNKL